MTGETPQSETKVGRPTKYTPELAIEICVRIATSTRSLRTICSAEDMPDVSQIYRWMQIYPEFREQYARAKADQADIFPEEILEIADDSRNDYIEELNAKGEVKGVYLDKENVMRSKLRIETRQWLAGKMKPKVYGPSPIGVQPLDKKGDPTDAFDPSAAATAAAAAVVAAMAAADQRGEADEE